MTRGEADDINTTVYLWNVGLLFKGSAFPPKEGALTAAQVPAALSEPLLARARRREVQLVRARPQVVSGEMDVNRNAWKSECVFCCGKVQVEP